MRDAFARAIYELARRDERVVVIVADISPAGAMEEFREDFPDRFYNVGIAEQTMIGIAAGLAQRGMRPFCYTIATFALLRAYEFIRCDLAYQDLPVTVVGMGAGLSYPTMGGTHQAIEDVAVAMACPGMTVLAPCDPLETAACVEWCGARESGGPVYMRIGKAGEPILTDGFDHWTPERGGVRWLRWMRRSSGRLDDIGTMILSYGPIARMALEVADALAASGEDTAVAAAPVVTAVDQIAMGVCRARRLIVIEEASGAPLASALVLRGVRIARSFCLPRSFPHVHGTREEVLAHCGLSVVRIVEDVRRDDRDRSE